MVTCAPVHSVFKRQNLDALKPDKSAIQIQWLCTQLWQQWTPSKLVALKMPKLKQPKKNAKVICSFISYVTLEDIHKEVRNLDMSSASQVMMSQLKQLKCSWNHPHPPTPFIDFSKLPKKGGSDFSDKNGGVRKLSGCFKKGGITYFHTN